MPPKRGARRAGGASFPARSLRDGDRPFDGQEVFKQIILLWRMFYGSVGIFTFFLEQDGPSTITGIDLSEGMLQIAKDKAKENGSRARFVSYDAARCADVIEKPVDLIFSSTTSHYIEDLDQLFSNVARSLKEGGESVFSVIHPIYSAMYPIEHGDAFPEDEDWTVRYLDRSMRAYVQPWIEYNEAFEDHLSKSYHHTFADYINAMIGAGLMIEQICEPMAPEKWKVSEPDRYEGFIETPVYMIVKMRKTCFH